MKYNENSNLSNILKYEMKPVILLINFEFTLVIKFAEVLLDQKYFNGIGNYLRCEIIYRANIRPFDPACDILKQCFSDFMDVSKPRCNLLELCRDIPIEVIQIGNSYYAPDTDTEFSEFEKWLQCYQKAPNNLVDSAGRTVWFFGHPGSLAPKNGKSRKPVLKLHETNDDASTSISAMKKSTPKDLPAENVDSFSAVSYVLMSSKRGKNSKKKAASQEKKLTDAIEDTSANSSKLDKKNKKKVGSQVVKATEDTTKIGKSKRVTKRSVNATSSSSDQTSNSTSSKPTNRKRKVTESSSSSFSSSSSSSPASSESSLPPTKKARTSRTSLRAQKTAEEIAHLLKS